MVEKISFELPAEIDIEFTIRVAEETIRYDREIDEIIYKSIPKEDVKKMVLDYLFENVKELQEKLEDRRSQTLEIGAVDYDTAKVPGSRYINIEIYGWDLQLIKKKA